MKKLILIILCLCLTACGTFAVEVKIEPPATGTALDAPTNLPEPTSAPTSTPLPTATTASEPTATTPAEPAPTADNAREDQSLNLAAIQMSDIRRGWGVETYGRVLKTGDGGNYWRDVSPARVAFERHSLFALNSETAWVVPAQLEQNNLVWRTQDGGQTWEASQPIPLGASKYSPLSLQFPDARHGWLLALAQGSNQSQYVVLFNSEDGGASWELVTSLNERNFQTYLPDTRTSMAFFDGQTGWLGGWWGQEDPTQWLTLTTNDGGVKWDTAGLRLPDLKSIQCNGNPLPEMAAGSMAVEITCTLPKDPKYLFHHVYFITTNVSPAWRSWKVPSQLLSLTVLNANQGWIMVTSDKPGLNEIRYTRDGGGEWQKLSEIAWKQAQFDFITDRLGWAIVGNGYATALVRTENGGKIWIQVRPAILP